jgi:F420-non-reducing hydrogenase iron-sulfur subunit
MKRMTGNTLTRSSISWLPAESKQSARAKITVFHCTNALNDIKLSESEDYEVKSIKLPCSSMTSELFLLKAFEAGADAVLVLVCPEGSCRYLEGNVRAAKRVNRIKSMLDAIGLDGCRLNIYNIPHGDQSSVDKIMDKTLADLKELGPNPAA